MVYEWTDDHWYDLLDDISSNAGRYVPVIGPELMVYEEGGEQHSIHQQLGRRLAEKLRIDERDLPSSFGPSEVIRAYQLRRRDFVSAKPYATIVEILREDKWPIPEPVRKLASIHHFSFFLNADWLPFIKPALEQERKLPVFEAGNMIGKRMQDFSEENMEGNICVFNLFGSVTASTPANPITFSVTDDDLLECMHRLLSNPPARTSAYLLQKNRELLVWGCSFSSWLARFFLYSLVRTVPLQGGEVRRMRVVADGLSASDENLRALWTRLNVPVYDGHSAVAFIDELHERWHKEFGDTSDPLVDCAHRIMDDANPFTAGEIFISYASENAEIARAIAAQLRDSGLPVWLDQDCLQGGNLYRAKIRFNIQYCSCFIPLISSEAIKNCEEIGFMYREEWLFARDQALLRNAGGMAEIDFILPLCIDSDIELDDDRLPEFIRDAHTIPWSDPLPDTWIERLREARKQFSRVRRGQL